MPLMEPSIFKVYFFSGKELTACARAAEKLKHKLNLGNKDAAAILSGFLRNLVEQTLPARNDVLDTPCEFTSDSHKLKVKYFTKGVDAKWGSLDGIFILTTTLNSNLHNVVEGWQELVGMFPNDLPNGPLDPLTVYYATFDKEVTTQEVTDLLEQAQKLFPEISSENLQGILKRTHIRCGNIYQIGTSEQYLLFSDKKEKLAASHFATSYLPLFNIYFSSGNVCYQNKELDKTRIHLKEVSEKIENKLTDYSKRGLGSFTEEAERKNIFNIAKDLWLLNSSASRILRLIQSVEDALSNLRNLKARVVVPSQDEIFCEKERLLELQKSQLQSDAAYLHNTFEAGRVVLDSIEDHMELEYTRELKESNKKSLSLQSAAFIIEFALVFYYFLGSWHYIIGEERFNEIPELARLGCATSIASILCAGTHLFAKWRLSKKKSYLYLTMGLLLPLLLGTLAFIVGFSLSAGKLGH